jgi:hypothetical protein
MELTMTAPQQWETASAVPVATGFFNKLLGDAGNLSSEAG